MTGGRVASRKDRPPRGRDGNQRFIMVTHYLLNCQAWLTLSSDAKAVLLHIWARHNGVNNGSIAYSVREAEEIGISKDRAARAIKELCEHGFLRVRRASSFTLKTKAARTWELTAEPCDGRAASKDFMRWSPGAKSETRSHQRDRQSHQRDSEPANEMMLPTSVAPMRPSSADPASARSHGCDTSNIPGEGSENPDAVAAERSAASTAPPAVQAALGARQLDLEHDYLDPVRAGDGDRLPRMQGITSARLSVTRLDRDQPANPADKARLAKISARAS
jgi:hypothetical protein